MLLDSVLIMVLLQALLYLYSFPTSDYSCFLYTHGWHAPRKTLVTDNNIEHTGLPTSMTETCQGIQLETPTKSYTTSLSLLTHGAFRAIKAHKSLTYTKLYTHTIIAAVIFGQHVHSGSLLSPLDSCLMRLLLVTYQIQ